MAPSPDANERPDHSPPGDGGHRMPRWVRGFLIAALVVVVLGVMALAFGGDHGPSRHFADNTAPTDTPPGQAPPAKQP